MADYLKTQIAERNNRYRAELEDYFRRVLVDEYPARTATLWQRDYSNSEAYTQSVAPNRKRWRAILNPPVLEITGEPVFEPVTGLEEMGAQFVRLPLTFPLRAEAIYATPAGKRPFPLVVCQHGIESTPEHVMGLVNEDDAYHAFGQRLVEAGFAVLATFNLAHSEPRERIVRLATMADTTLTGIELVRMQRLLDVITARPEIDPEKIGFWGLSLGGMTAQFWTPLEPRIKTAISAAWFNARVNKMVVPDPRYSCFLDTPEEHIWIRGWLTEFNDADLLSLVCPRPLLLTSGKADSIAWYPQIEEEFAQLKSHYERLGLSDRVMLDLHEGGHEIRVAGGIEWMRRWLG